MPPPTDRPLAHPTLASLCRWLCVAALCACAWPAAAEDEPQAAQAPQARSRSRVETLATAWDVPFWEQSAFLMEMGVGGGSVGGQLARVLDGGGAQIGMSMGWRWGFLSIEAPLMIQMIDTPVSLNASLVSWGLRSRLHMPLLDGAVRLTGGAAIYRTWATRCEEDSETTCRWTPDEEPAFADYGGNAWELSTGVSIPLLSAWGSCDECGCENANCATGGMEFLINVEYRRTWYDLSNGTLARTMNGYVDAVLVTFTSELMIAD